MTSAPDPQRRSSQALRPRWLLGILAIALLASAAHAQSRLLYGGEPVHPACIHALAMHQGDAVPVTTAVSLEGCASSDRSKAPVVYDGELAGFEDDAILGGGSFAYRELTRLDNGIIGLAIRRVFPDGTERVSLAAVNVVERAMVRQGRVATMQQIELLGEMWVPNIEILSFRSIGNRVHFVAGTGREKVERNVDFTRLGKLRK
jgi:hypothetical protein